MCSLASKRLNIVSLFKWPLNYNKFSKRYLATRKDSECGEHFKSGPCEVNKKPKKKDKQPQAVLPTIAEPEVKIKRSLYCCGDPCPDALPSFDKLYYRRTDKFQRSYQQTWNECPEQFIKPKVMCTRDVIKPKFTKRPRKERPQTAVKQEVCLQSKSKCPFVYMPRCRAGRKPPACLKQRVPSKCTKRKPPCQSLSECKYCRSKIKTVECSCLIIPSICEVWAQHHRQRSIRKQV